MGVILEMSARKLFIIDFDGTVADSYRLSIECIAQYKKTKIDDLEGLRGSPTIDVIRKFDLSIIDLLRLIFFVRREFYRRIEEIKPSLGILDAMRSLKSSGAVIQLISSNSRRNIEKFFTLHGAKDLLGEIEVCYTIFGKSRNLSRIVRSSGIDKNNIFYVGDETRDIEAAKKVGIRSISVPWGYNNRSILAQYSPDQLLTKASDLLGLV